MTIIELLESQNCRLSWGDSWLVFDAAALAPWQVYHKNYGQRVKLFGSANNEADAVKLLRQATGEDTTDD